jgi:hypothetical protein
MIEGSMQDSVNIPKSVYGVIERDKFDSDLEEVVEQIRRLGFGVLDSGFSGQDLDNISKEFNQIHAAYLYEWSEERLARLDEINTIRLPLAQCGQEWFMKIALNPTLLQMIQMLIPGKFILNQQNGIINPSKQNYNQGAWHRDLPYQHYVSSMPLAVNAIFCIDAFTAKNGATFVLPCSQNSKAFPSSNYVENNAVQIEAKAGQYIVLDCMLFHSGGYNRTDMSRRAVNHVFTIPFFKQQIKIPKLITKKNLSMKEQDILGFNYQEPISVDEYLRNREEKAIF